MGKKVFAYNLSLQVPADDDPFDEAGCSDSDRSNCSQGADLFAQEECFVSQETADRRKRYRSYFTASTWRTCKCSTPFLFPEEAQTIKKYCLCCPKTKQFIETLMFRTKAEEIRENGFRRNVANFMDKSKNLNTVSCFSSFTGIWAKKKVYYLRSTPVNLNFLRIAELHYKLFTFPFFIFHFLKVFLKNTMLGVSPVALK